ncbi:hypothetical protein BC829DRAFT_444524 [Chytridium lagenaria]|nr:hypothetical protein BC829DRAFT_444524 [Chytridium lagenaria]
MAANAQGFWQTFSVGLLRKRIRSGIGYSTLPENQILHPAPLHPQNNACNGPPSIDQVNVIMARFKRVVDSMNIMMYWMWKLLGDVAVRECMSFETIGFLEVVDGAAAPLPHATSFPVDLLTTTTRYHIGLEACFGTHLELSTKIRINHDYVVDNEPSPRRTIFRTWSGATECNIADYDPNQLGTPMAPGPPPQRMITELSCHSTDPANPIELYCRYANRNMPRKAIEEGIAKVIGRMVEDVGQFAGRMPIGQRQEECKHAHPLSSLIGNLYMQPSSSLEAHRSAGFHPWRLEFVRAREEEYLYLSLNPANARRAISDMFALMPYSDEELGNMVDAVQPAELRMDVVVANKFEIMVKAFIEVAATFPLRNYCANATLDEVQNPGAHRMAHHPDTPWRGNQQTPTGQLLASTMFPTDPEDRNWRQQIGVDPGQKFQMVAVRMGYGGVIEEQRGFVDQHPEYINDPDNHREERRALRQERKSYVRRLRGRQAGS